MQLINRSAKMGQRGDTIVEVLISVAVISLVLASAYAISNRNTSTTQDTQEHSQAQQIVQRQIESLRALSSAGRLVPAVVPPTGSVGGCVIGSGTGLVLNTSNDGSCTFASDGVTGNCTAEPCFNTGITRNAALNVYTVTASWTNVRGDATKVSMEYGI